MQSNDIEDMAEENSSTYIPSLLLVDDEKNILSSLRRIFRPKGYKVFTADSGREGLTILEKEDIDLVISDMRMPEMDGAEFLENVARRWPNCVRLLLTGYSDIESTINAINKGHIFKYISKPWEDNDLLLTVKNALEYKLIQNERDKLIEKTRQQNNELNDLNANLEEKVKSRTEELRQAMAQLELTHDSLKKSYISSVKVFSSLIGLRHGSLAGHSRRVSENAKKLALKLGMDNENAENVMIAGLLHDIGKIGLADEIIKKPFNTLTNEERSLYQKYPVVGEGALMALEPLNEAAKIIRHHHEHYDGRGYPDHLKADDIPLGARIIAVVNDYESLKSGTFTKDPVSKSQIRDFILGNKGKRYDSNVVEEFFNLIGDELKTEDERFHPVMSAGLEEGMVLAKDVISDEGVLLLAEGQILNNNIITRIRHFERSTDQDVVVYIKPARS